MTLSKNTSENIIIHVCGKNEACQVLFMAKPEKTKGKMLSFAFREMKVFSLKNVVNLKNEQKHILSELMMRKNSSGGG